MAGPKGIPARVRAKGTPRVKDPGKVFMRLMRYILRDHKFH